YGIRHTRHDMKAYLSWPVSASLSVSGASFTIFRAVTPAFSASTGPSGVSGELVFLPPRRSPDDDDPGPLAPDVRGKIVVAPGTVASILDMARVLQRHRTELARGVRFAWWPGHSFGRYPGSTWYVDHFWTDLDRHGVAYTNLDGSGRRGSRVDAVIAGGWPGLADFSREFAERLTGKTVSSRAGARPFRPGRDSDSSF